MHFLALPCMEPPGAWKFSHLEKGWPGVGINVQADRKHENEISGCRLFILFMLYTLPAIILSVKISQLMLHNCCHQPFIFIQGSDLEETSVSVTALHQKFITL